MKRGTVREDGKVFARMLNGKELWITKQQYEKREKKRKEYVRRCIQAYYRRRKSIRRIGEYDHQRNLYFCGVTSSGKEIWANKKFYEIRKKIIIRSKKKYVERCKSNYEPNNLKIGDVNPNNPNEYVVHKIGNKVFFGSISRLKEKLEKRKIIYMKRYIKAKKIRQHILKNIENRKRKGDSRQEDNKLFWEYNRTGKEIWLDPEIFHIKRNKDNNRRKLYRKKKKDAMLKQQSSNLN